MNKNIADALNLGGGYAPEKYLRIFNDLGDALPYVVPRLGVLDDGQFSDEIVEYFVIRYTENGTKVILIYFVQGGDGI